MDARGIIEFPHNGRFVAVGGNMRLAALKSMGMDTAQCVILPGAKQGEAAVDVRHVCSTSHDCAGGIPDIQAMAEQN